MSDVHERIHDHRQAVRAGATSEADPIRPVATAIASETRLLCLDEFAVADVADAMILSRLFERLFAEGLVLVATSNTAPDDLYRDGLNRPLFMPFVALLRQHAEIIDLKASIDYRLKKLAGTPIYVTPLGAAADGALDALWLRLTGAECGPPAAIMAKGREIRIPQAAEGVARFEFADLCDAPLGAADYARIARAFHTVMIDHVRVLAEGERNTARRLINLIDTLYDHRTKLVASAAAEPQALYTASRGAEIEAFARTASRLVEMRSAEYLGAPRCATEMAEVDPG